MELVRTILGFLRADIRIDSQTLPFSPLDLVVLLFILSVLFAVYKLMLYALRRALARATLAEATRTRVFSWSRLVLRAAVILSSLIFVGNLFGAELAQWLGKFVQFVNEPFFESGSTRISIVTLLFTIPLFYLASVSAKVARSFVDSTLLGRLSVDDAKKFTISSLIRYGVMGLVVLVGLSVIGIDLSALAVIFGFLGIGLGFGLQAVVANFFAGLVIIFTRPIKEGDRILASGHEGTVVQIRMLNAAINTLTNETIIIPNSELISSSVHNYSYLDRRVIIVNTVQVSYGSDLDRVVRVLYETATRNPHALTDPEPIIRVASFGESGIDMEVRTWIEDVLYKLVALSWTNLEIWRAFKENGIQIPYPQMDLHVVPPPHQNASTDEGEPRET